MDTPKTQPTSAEVIPLHAPQSQKAVKVADAKWGVAVMQAGYCMIPSLLLRAQNRLKLTSTQLAVLLQLCDFWWEEARKPYPSKETLATRMGMTARQVQRHLAALESKNMIKRVARYDTSNGGRGTNIYDLSGLVAQLQAIEPDFRKVEEGVKQSRRSVLRRTYPRTAAANQQKASA
jgi:predicted transcriptional regulator